MKPPTSVLRQAIEQHPEHFYLKKAREHIAFVQNISEETLLELYLKNVGRYPGKEVITIWVEQNQLFWKQEGFGRRILLPISSHEFITLSSYDLICDFEQTNGVVDIYQEYLYNHELKIFERDEDWRVLKEVLAD